MKIKVILVSSTGESLTELRRQMADEEIILLDETVANTDTPILVKNKEPDMVVFTLSEGDQATLNLAERIITYMPRCFVVLVAERLSMSVMQSAMSIGAHNVTVMTDNPKELTEYVKGVYRSESKRLRAISDSQDVTWSSQVVSVFSAKGGIGKTSLAVNLAVSLAERGKKVALVDLDLQFGDVTTFLDLDPHETIGEMFQDNVAFSIDIIRSYMSLHPSGLHILSAPKSPEYAEMIPAKQIQQMLATMRSYYDYVILDTASVLNDITMTALEVSSRILFLTSLDLSALRKSRVSLNLLEQLQQTDKVRLIVSRSDDSSTVKAEDVSEVLHMPIEATLPNDTYTALGAINRGTPFIVTDSGSKLGHAISALTDRFLGIAPKHTHKMGSLFRSDKPKKEKAPKEKKEKKEKPEKKGKKDK